MWKFSKPLLIREISDENYNELDLKAGRLAVITKTYRIGIMEEGGRGGSESCG